MEISGVRGDEDQFYNSDFCKEKSSVWNGRTVRLESGMSPLMTKCSKEATTEVEVVGTASRDDKGNVSGSASVKVSIKSKGKF